MQVSDLYGPIMDNLMGRTVDPLKMDAAIVKSVLEFTESYKFGELQISGPIVQLTPGIPNYDISFFTTPGDPLYNINNINMVNSFFIFTSSYVDPASAQYTGTNAGYDLVYRTIDRLEVLLNLESVPTNWSRYNNQIWIAARPDTNYNIYMRYQHQHPFPNAGTPLAGTDTIFMPDSWTEIIEYAASQRLAQHYNLSTKASEFNVRLKGDDKFQQSRGIEGSPGLIFQRTSQEQRDQLTTTKRFRLRMGRV